MPDVRLIDANALIRKIEDGVWIQIEDHYGRAIGRERLNPDFAFVINEMPTIDAQPVKWGNWKQDASGELYCPYCMYVPQWDDDKFCAHCGADMRGDKNEQE